MCLAYSPERLIREGVDAAEEPDDLSVFVCASAWELLHAWSARPLGPNAGGLETALLNGGACCSVGAE